MLAIFNVVIPVFMIIGLGYLAVRFRLYPSEGVRGLVAFVNNFLTPCLLFQSMLHADFGTAFNWHVILPFYAGAMVAFIAGAIVASRLFGNRPGESVSSGFSAMFTNTVLLGIPILQRAYGDAALQVAFSIIALHASVLITIAMITMELVRRDGAPSPGDGRGGGPHCLQPAAGDRWAWLPTSSTSSWSNRPKPSSRSCRRRWCPSRSSASAAR